MNALSWFGLATAVVVTDVLLVWCGYAWCRRRSRLMAREAAPVQYFEEQISSMNQVIGHIGGCLDTIEQGLAAERTAPKSEPASPPPKKVEPEVGDKSELYRIASRFARRGSTAPELMADCGLSRGEAETIANLQTAAPAPGA